MLHPSEPVGLVEPPLSSLVRFEHPAGGSNPDCPSIESADGQGGINVDFLCAALDLCRPLSVAVGLGLTSLDGATHLPATSTTFTPGTLLEVSGCRRWVVPDAAATPP